jgi:hypothetical protein
MERNAWSVPDLVAALEEHGIARTRASVYLWLRGESMPTDTVTDVLEGITDGEITRRVMWEFFRDTEHEQRSEG